MNQEAARLKRKPLEPGAPLDLAEARNAVELARLAGADRYAAETFDKSAQLLSEAETARTAGRRGDAIMMPARQAAQTAEDARLIALRRQEEEYASRQRALAAEREAATLQRAQVEESRRRQAEDARRAEEARREQAENQTRAAEQARAAAERAQADADRARTDAERAADRLAQERRAADEARAAAESARAAAEAEARSSAAQPQQTAAQAEREKAELRDRLREQLNVILETRETARGLIVNLGRPVRHERRATPRRARVRSWPDRGHSAGAPGPRSRG